MLLLFNEMIDKHHHNGLLSSLTEVGIGMMSQFCIFTLMYINKHRVLAKQIY